LALIVARNATATVTQQRNASEVLNRSTVGAEQFRTLPGGSVFRLCGAFHAVFLHYFYQAFSLRNELRTNHIAVASALSVSCRQLI
jgi:hypothetical protein